MSSLWTPDGERRVPPAPTNPPPPSEPPPPPGPAGPTPGPGAGTSDDYERARHEELAQVQRQLLQAPPEVVVANHAFGLFELAALHLSQEQPDFASARLAVDAMGALVEGLSGRLGEVEAELADGLAQIRLAFVQVQAAKSAPGANGGSPPS